MPKNIASIEDLMRGEEPEETDDDSNEEDTSVQTKLSSKQKEIKIKEIERATDQTAASLGLPYIYLFGYPITPETLFLISEDEARKLNAVSFFYDGKIIKLGILEATEEIVKLQSKLAEKYHSRVDVYLVSEHSLNYILNLYSSFPRVRKFERGVSLTEEDLKRFSEKFTSFHDLQKEIVKSKVTDIVTMIMAASIKSGASDIHVEAEEKEIKVRFRIDGVLHDAATIDGELWRKIISRMKVLAKVKINVTDKPQDGRMSITTKKDRIDIRTSFLPTNYGESVVMRLLRSGVSRLEFEKLGIRGLAFERLKQEIKRPNGMIITTGPTGSGKTTTLYAILKKLNNQQTKIITIEDPIEYQLVGINQSQTSDKYTFTQGLRSIVRQDPDVIMVGEIRDLEAAEIAIQAALTGHLVLSTIHTNDAAGTVPRFLSMGTKPFLFAPAINAAIGQRLVRLICSECKVETELDGETNARVIRLLEKMPEGEKAKVSFETLKFYKGAGCKTCQGIGYRGQMGIYEIMTFGEELEDIIMSGRGSEYAMRQMAVKQGMVSMAQDGLLKAIDGLISVEEVFRVAEDK